MKIATPSLGAYSICHGIQTGAWLETAIPSI